MVRARVEPVLNEYNQNTLLEQHGLITKAEKERLLDKYFKSKGKGRYEKVQASAKPSFNPHLNTSSIMLLKWIEEQSNAGFSLKHLIEKHILENKGEIIDLSKCVPKMGAEDFDRKLIEVMGDGELQTHFGDYNADVVYKITEGQQIAPVTTMHENPPVTTEHKTVPVTIEGENTPVTTEHKTVPVTTERENTPVTTEHKTVPVTTEHENTPVTEVKDAVPPVAENPRRRRNRGTSEDSEPPTTERPERKGRRRASSSEEGQALEKTATHSPTKTSDEKKDNPKPKNVNTIQKKASVVNRFFN